VRATASALLAALLASGCFWRWWGGDEEGETPAVPEEIEGPFAGPRQLCERAAGELGLRTLRPWDSRLLGHYDCVAATPPFGVAPGPIRSYVALHVYGRAPSTALEIALQANVLDPNDERDAFAALERLVERTFAHLGEPVPPELREAIAQRHPTALELPRAHITWSSMNVGGPAVSWTLHLVGTRGT
jgi:hypothetical protein